MQMTLPWLCRLAGSPSSLQRPFHVVEVIAAHAQKLAVRVLRSDGRPPPRKTRFPAAAVGGPPREFAVEAKFPEWITYTPGIATVLALSAAYVGLLAAWHGVMRLVAGPAKGSRLARWPWEAAQSGAAPDRGRL